MIADTQNCVSWTTSAGQIELLPAHGRVLQVQVGAEKAFWQPEEYLGDWNVGGDRLWLSPEADWFHQYEGGKATSYEVPKTLDPGTWSQRVCTKQVCEWEQLARLKNQRQNNFLEVSLRRRITLLPDVSHAHFTRSLAYATDDSATILTGIPEQQIGFWSLIQVPSGGQAYVGTRGAAAGRDYFNLIPESERSVTERYVRFEFAGKKSFKVGVSPEAATGTFLYVRPASNGDYVGIVRRFFCQPWRGYCDAPLTAEGQGDAVQVYCDDGTLGAFGEIEYHSAAFPASEAGAQFGASHLTIVGTIAAGDIGQWLDHWNDSRL